MMASDLRHHLSAANLVPSENAEISSTPARAGIQNKLEKSGMFSTTKNRQSTNHLYHAFHHKLTTKTPDLSQEFRENPCKSVAPPHQEKIGG
jgi:hypothetical protein